MISARRPQPDGRARALPGRGLQPRRRRRTAGPARARRAGHGNDRRRHGGARRRGRGARGRSMSAATVPGWLAAVTAGQPRRPAIFDGTSAGTTASSGTAPGGWRAGCSNAASSRPAGESGSSARTPPSTWPDISASCVPEASSCRSTIGSRPRSSTRSSSSSRRPAASSAPWHPTWRASSRVLRPGRPATLTSAARPGPPTTRSDAEATVLLTSGTTGAPKGVVHTHATLLHAALQVSLALPFARDDVNIAFLPFFASIPEQVLPVPAVRAAARPAPRASIPRLSRRACERATTLRLGADDRRAAARPR